MKWVFWGIFQKRVLLLRKRKRLPFRKEYVIFTWYPLLPFNCRKLMIYSVEVDLIFPPTFSLVADPQIFTLFRSLLYQKTTSLSCITSFNLNVIFTSTKLLHWIFLLVTSCSNSNLGQLTRPQPLLPNIFHFVVHFWLQVGQGAQCS